MARIWKVIVGILGILVWPFKKITWVFLRLLRWDPCLAILVMIVLPVLMYMGSYYIYTKIDPTTFPKLNPEIAKGNPKMTDNEKGAYLASALTYQLKRELGSRFSWTPNSVTPPFKYLDNRKNRQSGVIFATRMLTEFFATSLGKYGRADREDENLLKARTKYFSFSEDSFWLPSSEEMYWNGIQCIENYKSNLLSNRTTFNIRSDDIYNLLNSLIDERCLGPVLGLLIQTNQEVGFQELDDHVYYTQGVVLVLRDFLHSLVKVHPEIVEKGGKENLEIAFKNMDKICTFDPWIVLGGEHDSMLPDHRGKIARYLINIRERINDVSQSLRR